MGIFSFFFQMFWSCRRPSRLSFSISSFFHPGTSPILIKRILFSHLRIFRSISYLSCVCRRRTNFYPGREALLCRLLASISFFPLRRPPLLLSGVLLTRVSPPQNRFFFLSYLHPQIVITEIFFSLGCSLESPLSSFRPP